MKGFDAQTSQALGATRKVLGSYFRIHQPTPCQSAHATSTIQLFCLSPRLKYKKEKKKEKKTNKNYDKPQLLSKRHTLGTRPPPRRTADMAGTTARSGRTGGYRRPPLPVDGCPALRRELVRHRHANWATSDAKRLANCYLRCSAHTATTLLDRHRQTRQLSGRKPPATPGTETPAGHHCSLSPPTAKQLGQ